MKEHRLILTIFGASGDLASRKLYPAIYQLYQKGYLKTHFAVIGTARRTWTHEYFRQVVKDSLPPTSENDQVSEFLSHFYYQSHDVTQAEHYFSLKNLADQLDQTYQTFGNRLFYISLAPQLFPIITRQLKEEGFLTPSGYNRLIIEKPFGYDEQSAIELQTQLLESFEEDQIYRIDHYLGKSIVNQLLPIRYQNRISQFLWDPQEIDHIQITLNEELGIQDRGSYYEGSGVSRDMIQNHALQLLAITCLHLPKVMSAHELHFQKIKILKHLTPYQDLTDLKQHVVRGQYTRSIDGQEIAYREEDHVDPNSQVETFMALKINIDDPDWKNTPIYIRSGKQIKQKKTDIKLVYPQIAPTIPANYLQIELAPRPGIRLCLSQCDSTYLTETKRLDLSYQVPHDLAMTLPGDYEKLLFDCMNGDLSNFVHYEEALLAWRFIDRIHELWQLETEADLAFYPAKSQGPQASDDLLDKDHRAWIND